MQFHIFKKSSSFSEVQFKSVTKGEALHCNLSTETPRNFLENLKFI